MTLLERLNPFSYLKFELFGRSLSGRVLWLTVGIILLVEGVILMPGLGRERQTWLWDRVTRAHLAAFSAGQNDDAGFSVVPANPHLAAVAPVSGELLDPAARDRLLHLSGAEAIRMIQNGHQDVLLQPGVKLYPSKVINLGTETLLQSIWQADLRVAGLGAPQIEVLAPSPLDRTVSLDIVLDGDKLTTHLRLYAEHIAELSVITALVTGLLVFAALDRLLVRPMRIMTASIVGFRKDPEHDDQNELVWLSARRNDEIAGAARELKVMQDEMRSALWRNARLAAVGVAVAKISHDLRNILSSALLVADRLGESADPIAQRAARTLIPAVERAAQMVSRTVDFAREGPPAVTRTAVVLAELVDEAALVVRPEDAGVTIDNQVPDGLVLPLDRMHIYRVLVNLMRNAAEAGADKITISTKLSAGVTKLTVRDNGPGLPVRVQDNLFKPFTGSGRKGGTGLGLVIARDLVRAHGGDLTLADTGRDGTVFVMELAVNEVVNEANRTGFSLPPLEQPAPAAVPLPAVLANAMAMQPPEITAPAVPDSEPAAPKPPRKRPTPVDTVEAPMLPVKTALSPLSTARRRRARPEKSVGPIGIEGVSPSRN